MITFISNELMFDEGYKTFITGSNASLLSKELRTKLTGRHAPRTVLLVATSKTL